MHRAFRLSVRQASTLVGVILGIILLVIAVALAVIGGLGWSGKLPGNSFIGLKVPEVRKSEELWELAHKIAGPFWVLGAVALAFGGAFSFVATGWWWILPALTIVVALGSVGTGAAKAAHTVAALDARAIAEEQRGGTQPAVNLDALRNAAKKLDN